MTLLFQDDLFLKHETGQHPECPDRLRSIHDRLAQSGLPARCLKGEYQPLAIDESIFSKVHEADVVARVKQAVEAGGGRLDPDTVVSPDSLTVMLATTGVCLSAVRQVLEGVDKNALCLVRPPGHHATRDRSMGFCLVNNVALAAEYARQQHGLKHILIVDWDVHHGNGTQDIFYDDPEITFFSQHQYGFGFYPGTGNFDETGTGAGRGHTINVPVPYGTRRVELRNCFQQALEKAAEIAKPELILLSAGFDAHFKDPIGGLELETQDFREMTREVLEIARTHAQGRLVSCLEGGYNLQALAECVEVHLEEMVNEGSST
ncbi:MAG: histone deacetylase [Gemmataceae bacterium]